MKKMRSEDFYNKESVKYDKLRLLGDGNSVNDILQKSTINDFLSDLDKDCKVLEIAPGTGRLTELLDNHFHDITAVDISSEMLKQLSAKNFSNKINLIHSDIVNYSTDKKFDLIFFINAASHMEDFEKVCQWCSKHLSKDGVVYFNFPNIFSIYFLPGLYVKLTNRSLLRNVFTRWYSTGEVSKIAKNYGLKTNRASGITHAPLGTPRIIGKLMLFLNKFLKHFNYFFGSQIFIKLNRP